MGQDSLEGNIFMQCVSEMKLEFQSLQQKLNDLQMEIYWKNKEKAITQHQRNILFFKLCGEAEKGVIE